MPADPKTPDPKAPYPKAPYPKAMARRLREQLRSRGLDLTHGECLDIVARQLGHRNWNVLAARPTTSALVRVQRSCEWVARNGERELGRIRAVRRPDDRWFVSCDTWYDGAHDALVDAVVDDLGQDLYANVDAEDAPAVARYTGNGFVVHRREDEVTVDVAGARAALASAGPPDGFTIVSAADADVTQLRLLDDLLRRDVPGCDGWVNDPQEFREYTFSPSHFDPALYLVALDADGGPAGLVRVWTAPAPHRLGLVGVRREHRRRGLARALLRAAFEAAAARGVGAVVAEVDVDNEPSAGLLRALGARRTGTSLELRRTVR